MFVKYWSEHFYGTHVKHKYAIIAVQLCAYVAVNGDAEPGSDWKEKKPFFEYPHHLTAGPDGLTLSFCF